jgi:hypothetical protein
MKDVVRLDERGLEEWLSEPLTATRAALQKIEGDVAVLGAGGKMGPTLAMMLKKAAPGKTVYAVSRFSDNQVRQRIEEHGVRIVEADLLDESAYDRLPEVPNVYYLAGMKFGASGNQPLTWAMNVYMPALVASGTGKRGLSLSRPATCIRSRVRPAAGRARRTFPIPSANTPSRASAASGCSSTSRSASARPSP